MVKMEKAVELEENTAYGVVLSKGMQVRFIVKMFTKCLKIHNYLYYIGYYASAYMAVSYIMELSYGFILLSNLHPHSY